MLKDEIGEIVSTSCSHSNGICSCVITATRSEAACIAAKAANNDEIDRKIAKLRELKSVDFDAQIADLEAQKQGE